MNRRKLHHVLTGMAYTGVVLLHIKSGDLLLGVPTRVEQSITLRGKMTTKIHWELESQARYTAPMYSINRLEPYGFAILGAFL